MNDKLKKSSNQPPVLGSWRNFYALVVAVLIVLILSFYLITQHYA